MPFHIVDRERQRLVSDLETHDEATQRLAELLEVTPDADLSIVDAGDTGEAESADEPVISEEIDQPKTQLVAQPEPELRDQIERVRDTES